MEEKDFGEIYDTQICKKYGKSKNFENETKIKIKLKIKNKLKIKIKIN